MKEFKATFSTMFCELELKYGINYTEAFAFKQLARYVHYETLDVSEQHSLTILGFTQILNLVFATTITTTSQVALQAAIAHHRNVPNNPYPIPISINLFLQQLIITTANIPPTNDAPTFVNPVGNSFEFFS